MTAQAAHFLALTVEGHLRHTMRRDDGSWTAWGNVEQMIGSPGGALVHVDCASVAGELNVCVVLDSGELRHTIRRHDGSWTSWGNVEQMTGPTRGELVQVACTGVDGELHVIGVFGEGTLRHTIRRHNGTWTPWGDVERLTGEAGNLRSVSVAGVGAGTP